MPGFLTIYWGGRSARLDVALSACEKSRVLRICLDIYDSELWGMS